MKRPFAVAGVSLLTFTVVFFQTGTVVRGLCFAVCAALCLFSAVRKKKRAVYCLLTVLLTLAAALLSVRNTETNRFAPLKALAAQSCRVTGTASDFCEAYTAEYGTVTLKNCSVNGINLQTDIFTLFPQSFSCACGDTVSADVFFFSRASDRAADYPDGVFLTAWANGNITVQPGNRHFFVYYARLARVRLARILDAHMPAREAAVTKALLLGDKSSLPDDFVSALKICGASHLFAVSGMHLSLWTGIIFLFLRKRSRTKWLPNLGVSLFVLFYMALTGFSPSVVRAGIMLLTVFAGFCFRRPADPLNSLGLSALILLLIEPLNAVNVSFLLSFNATASILLLYPYLERRASEKRDKKRRPAKTVLIRLLNAVLLSLGAILFTAPVSGEYFGSLSLLSPVSSLLCTLPAEALMLCSAAAAGLRGFSFAGGLLFGISSFLAGGIDRIIAFLSRFDFAVCGVDPKPLLLWYAFSAVICAAVWYTGSKKAVKTLTALLVCAGMLLPVGMLNNLRNAKYTWLYLPDAGNCGTALIYAGYGAASTLLYCGENENSLYTVREYAEKHNIYAIRSLIMPAGSAENLSAAQAAGRELQTNAVYGSDYPSGGGFLCRVTESATYENDSESGIGVFVCGKIKTVFCFFAGTPCAESIPEGNILVCRSQLPENLNTGNYEKIIVLSDKTAGQLALPENAVSTADSGGITVKYENKGDTYAFYR